jgi:hypothetical protein
MNSKLETDIAYRHTQSTTSYKLVADGLDLLERVHFQLRDFDEEEYNEQ